MDLDIQLYQGFNVMQQTSLRWRLADKSVVKMRCLLRNQLRKEVIECTDAFTGQTVEEITDASHILCLTLGESPAMPKSQYY